MRALPVLAAALAAAGVAPFAPFAAAVPDATHVNVAFFESGCAGTEFCLRVEPDSPTFTWGEQVEFVLVNPATNAFPHNLQVTKFGSVSEPVRPGEEKLFLLAMRQAGEFTIYSAVLNAGKTDRERGMEASFTVVDPTEDDARVRVGAPGGALALAAAAVAAVALARPLASGPFKRE